MYGPVETFYSGGGLVASTVDYIMVERQSLNQVLSCKVLDNDCVNLSSHLPVFCLLRFSLSSISKFNKQKKLYQSSG